MIAFMLSLSKTLYVQSVCKLKRYFRFYVLFRNCMLKKELNDFVLAMTQFLFIEKVRSVIAVLDSYNVREA